MYSCSERLRDLASSQRGCLPAGGWNAEVKYMPTAQEGPGNWFKAYVGGADEGRVRSQSSSLRVCR